MTQGSELEQEITRLIKQGHEQLDRGPEEQLYWLSLVERDIFLLLITQHWISPTEETIGVVIHPEQLNDFLYSAERRHIIEQWRKLSRCLTDATQNFAQCGADLTETLTQLNLLRIRLHFR